MYVQLRVVPLVMNILCNTIIKVFLRERKICYTDQCIFRPAGHYLHCLIIIERRYYIFSKNRVEVCFVVTIKIPVIQIFSPPRWILYRSTFIVHLFKYIYIHVYPSLKYFTRLSNTKSFEQ